MATLTLRSAKGAPLTNNEVDANFSNLNADVATRAVASNNLSDLSNTNSARQNLGLGTAAVKNAPASGNAQNTEVVLGSDTRLSDARPPTAHNHDAAYLGINSKAADADKLDGYDSTAFVRSVNGAPPNAAGDVAVNVDLSSRVAKTGDSMSGNLTMTGSAVFVSSRPGNDARNTGFKMSDGQDLGEMDRSTQYYDDRVSNCNGYVPNGNCNGNPQWTPPNGNWWEWYASIGRSAWENNGAYDGAGGTSYSYNAVSVSYNYDAYYLAADEIGGAEYRRNYRNCNCGAFNCRTNCNCNCNCNCK